MFKVLLWDHDGVLVDTEGLYFRATREALESVGVDLDSEQYRQLFLVGGNGAWHLAAQQGVPEQRIKELKLQRNERYRQLLVQEEVLFPGALTLLSELVPHYRMAIVTSTLREHFDAIHQHTGLPHHFELILTRHDYVHAKPEPEPYLTALAKLNVSAAECLVIEDSERGLRAAKAAGLSCWVLPSPLTRGSSFEAADRRLNDLTELRAALLAERPR